MRLSTGLRNDMLDPAGGSLASVMGPMKVDVYAGTRPASADDAVPGGATLLVTFDDDGTGTTEDPGLDFGDAAAGVVGIDPTEDWQGEAVASGIAAWFRAYRFADSPSGASTTLPRIDGSVAVSGADMSISNTNIVAETIQRITAFNITMPAGS